MPRPKSLQLTDAEHRIMSVLWERGEASVREVTEALEADHGLAYTTILTTMKIMAEKEYVAHRKEGRAFVYRPLLTRQGARRQALGTVLSSLFNGSPRSLAMHLVEDEKLSLEDIEALRRSLLESEVADKEEDDR